MKRPELPANEAARLEALRAYRILDTAPERAFDELTELAAQICGTPIAMVSLVDEDRQWFKSRHGTESTGTPREVAFCAHAIHESEVFVVEDSSRDPRFHDNPLAIGDPHIRFYAGAQLRTPEGHTIGMLCVIDHEPRRLTGSQIRSLDILAKRVIGELERIKAFRIVREQQESVALSAKFSALGEMAAGVAHEINNPLTIIKGKASCLLAMVKAGRFDPVEYEKVITKIDSTVTRIARIVRGLRGLSRDAERDPLEPAELDQIFADTLELCAARIRNEGIDLRVDTGAPVRLDCRPAQISQVLLNLLGNAADAVAPLAEKWIELKVESQGTHLRIAVTDSGRGIEPAVAEKIMRPFYTTKEAGKGTGLGLSITRKIAEAHGGTLVLDPSAPNTRFVLTLPVRATVKARCAA